MVLGASGLAGAVPVPLPGVEPPVPPESVTVGVSAVPCVPDPPDVPDPPLVPPLPDVSPPEPEPLAPEPPEPRPEPPEVPLDDPPEVPADPLELPELLPEPPSEPLEVPEPLPEPPEPPDEPLTELGEPEPEPLPEEPLETGAGPFWLFWPRVEPPVLPGPCADPLPESLPPWLELERCPVVPLEGDDVDGATPFIAVSDGAFPVPLEYPPDWIEAAPVFELDGAAGGRAIGAAPVARIAALVL